MISNNSSFIKKSLIELAIEFENKVIDMRSEDNNTNLENKEVPDLSLETKNEDENETSKNSEISKSLIEEKALDSLIVEENNTKENEQDKNNENTDAPLQSSETDSSKITLDEDADQNANKIEFAEQKNENDIESLLETPSLKTEETEQALNSVRDAVSKSINNSIEDNGNDSDINDQKQNNSLKEIKQDMDHFKNIFSELSNLTENVIHENIENKIIEFASELAGYQIDKMPDKYEKKIKTFLKSINRFEDKMSIETNDKDYEALLKIENFKTINETIKFTPNSDISRGDIILNCDGMHYSETNIKNK